MALKEFIENIKQDMNRTYKATKSLDKEIDRTYMFRIYIIFILNICGIIGFSVMKEDFPVPVFVAIWGVSALIVIDILWHLFSDNIAKNMPDLFVVEYQKYGVPAHEFKCRVNFVGNTHFRGFSCRIYVWENAVIIRFGKKCLVVDNAQQIKISKAVFGYRCEVDKDGKYVQCNMSDKQAEILQQWKDKKIEK